MKVFKQQCALKCTAAYFYIIEGTEEWQFYLCLRSSMSLRWPWICEYKVSVFCSHGLGLDVNWCICILVCGTVECCRSHLYPPVVHLSPRASSLKWGKQLQIGNVEVRECGRFLVLPLQWLLKRQDWLYQCWATLWRQLFQIHQADGEKVSVWWVIHNLMCARVARYGRNTSIAIVLVHIVIAIPFNMVRKLLQSQYSQIFINIVNFFLVVCFVLLSVLHMNSKR